MKIKNLEKNNEIEINNNIANEKKSNGIFRHNFRKNN